MEEPRRPAVPVPRRAGRDVVGSRGAGRRHRPADAATHRASRRGRRCGRSGPSFLVHDLHRPERFLHMLRVFKPTSPLSVGTWILSPFATFAAATAASEVTGPVPARGRRVRGGRRGDRAGARHLHRRAVLEHRRADLARGAPRAAVRVRRQRRGRRWRDGAGRGVGAGQRAGGAAGRGGRGRRARGRRVHGAQARPARRRVPEGPRAHADARVEGVPGGRRGRRACWAGVVAGRRRCRGWR